MAGTGAAAGAGVTAGAADFLSSNSFFFMTLFTFLSIAFFVMVFPVALTLLVVFPFLFLYFLAEVLRLTILSFPDRLRLTY